MFSTKGFLEVDVGHIQAIHGVPKTLSNWAVDEKIGNGTCINVFSTLWMQSLPTMKLTTAPPQPPHMEDLLVHDVLHPHLNSWNSDLIHSIFGFQDAMTILSISPYAKELLLTLMFWKVTTDGNYSVKSAYFHCMCR